MARGGHSAATHQSKNADSAAGGRRHTDGERAAPLQRGAAPRQRGAPPPAKKKMDSAAIGRGDTAGSGGGVEREQGIMMADTPL